MNELRSQQFAMRFTFKCCGPLRSMPRRMRNPELSTTNHQTNNSGYSCASSTAVPTSQLLSQGKQRSRVALFSLTGECLDPTSAGPARLTGRQHVRCVAVRFGMHLGSLNMSEQDSSMELGRWSKAWFGTSLGLLSAVSDLALRSRGQPHGCNLLYI
jgi:hypothetical protein